MKIASSYHMGFLKLHTELFYYEINVYIYIYIYTIFCYILTMLEAVPAIFC